MKGRLVLLLLCAALLPGSAAMAQDVSAPFMDSIAPRILMVEEVTGTTLIARRVDEPIAPGSMAKLMSVETVLDALGKGEIAPETAYPVSEFAWRTGGAPSRTTTMFAAPRSVITVSDLLSGVIVQNANDGAIILAEGISGSQAAFATRMNERARVLGLSGSFFDNPTGLPPTESRVTMRDLVKLARHLKTTYPEHFPLYAQADFTWNRIRQTNKNPVLKAVEGADGFGAGFAEGAGFGLVATAARGDVRLYLALSGLASERERLTEAARLLEWGFKDFRHVTVFRAGEGIAAANVYGGEAEKVVLSPREDIRVYVPAAEISRISAEVVYGGPLRAPLERDSEAGRVKVKIGSAVLMEAPVYTAAAVGTGNFVARARDAVWSLLFFWL